ncbi:c-type cytochrome [Ferrovibrio xuzhouensis]|uniref:C-type cytochrome n=1 Tax=Ferrovibrio xuzhouensis TaxID=1576914 RepID=A0ABV7VJ44_9PROT
MSRTLFSAVAALAFGLGIANAHAAGDAAEGKKSFAKCHACHQLVEGKNGVGPSLHGLFGRKAGTAPGYKYSSAMQSKGVTWDEATLRQYLTDPKGFVPGNKMAFPGIKKESELENLIAYLKDATK